MRISISIFKYRIYCKFAFVVIVLAFKQNRLKLKGSSNYVAPVNSRPARRGRVKPSNLKTKNEKIRQPKALTKKPLLDKKNGHLTKMTRADTAGKATKA